MSNEDKHTLFPWETQGTLFGPADLGIGRSPEPNPDTSNQVGDINSDEVGSGARYNGGKPDFSLLIIKDLPVVAASSGLLVSAIKNLGEFQISGDADYLDKALKDTYVYAHTQLETEYVFEPVVRVWEFGQRKYARWNWTKGMAWSVPIACAVRHWLAIVEKKEPIDEDSGYPHWAHIVCNLQMLKQYTRSYLEGNDLPYLTYQKDDRFTISGTLTEFDVTAWQHGAEQINGTLQFQTQNSINQN